MPVTLLLISDMDHPLALLEMPNGYDIDALRAEFEAILAPGENPRAYDSPVQAAWIERVRERENFLVAKYGGTEDGNDPPRRQYSPRTFANWLVREKGAKAVKFEHYGMYEFD